MTVPDLTLRNSDLSVTIAALGAEMQRLQYRGTDLLWHGDAEWWSGRAPVLFPIVGPAPGGVLEIDGRPYEMAQHGFARRSVFDLIDQDESSCTHQLTDSAATRAQYPFAFALRVTHAIDAGALSVTAEVENRDVVEMPFSFGFHPAFLWPLPGAEGRAHSITLTNGAEPPLARIADQRLPEARLPSPFANGQLTLSHDQFDADAMLFPEGAGSGLIYHAPDGPGVRFSFDNLPNLAIWSKPGPAPFVCIEPWHGMHARAGAPADIAARPYGLTLPPGGTARFGYSLSPQL